MPIQDKLADVWLVYKNNKIEGDRSEISAGFCQTPYHTKFCSLAQINEFR